MAVIAVTTTRAEISALRTSKLAAMLAGERVAVDKAGGQVPELSLVTRLLDEELGVREK